MTLEAFYGATGIELSLIASDITASKMLILNHRTAPDCPLMWALRMTTSLPLIWPPVTWCDGWGTYTGEDISGHLIADGEILSTFPIELLLSDQPEVTAWVGEKRHPHVLGLPIDEALPVPGAPPFVPHPTAAALGGLPAAAALLDILDAVARSTDKATVNAVEGHIARLPGKGYHMLEFAMSNERFNALIAAGRQAMRRYFARHQDTALSPEALSRTASARQYIDDSATRQLSRIIYNYYINTEGGAYIEGNVDTSGGDVIGRDVQQR
jgi:predicted acylesterase/phospholipase RssA